jgi:hypothetical protein
MRVVQALYWLNDALEDDRDRIRKRPGPVFFQPRLRLRN